MKKVFNQKSYLIFMVSCLLMAASSTVKAQWIVTDPTNIATSIVNTANQIVQTSSTAANMVKNFQETVKIFEQGKEFYDALKSVHNLVKDAKKVQKTVLLVGEISELYVTNFQKMMNDPNFSEKEILAIANGYSFLLDESSDMLQEVRDIITETGMSISDSERMEIIDRVYMRVKSHRDLVSYYTRKNISISYLRSKKAGDTSRMMALYGSADEKYW